ALLAEARDSKKVKSDVQDMRRRLNEAKPSEHALDVRSGAGGLQDIELFAQTATYLSGQSVRRLGDQIGLLEASFQITEAETAQLRNAAAFFWNVQAALRLLFLTKMPEDVGTSALTFLLKTTGCSDMDALTRKLAATRDDVAAVITAHLAGSHGTD
ncbi:MAG: hypothetical protein AAFY39_09095, partial [Pseudomonadota bacterium]